ncbi:von Willebrand factor type A domain-containing protein [Mycena rosella]|uniref:von Willebrand factor type A domain-containing protein n=1 Tax=Mycena rosella TaxID=1033263 RepID=A0AAD7GA55_MYCRO|nr:von Willebrand factor type A domain-containing protein [Mycena rosella]
MTSLPWGLYYASDNGATSLPLLHVRATASIKELAAQVKLTHIYSNDTDEPLVATYSFPIPARAAVCSFVMIKQDGTRVVGHVQEKEEARDIYGLSVVQGKQAALVEQQTVDVLQVIVGNIQSQEQVQIELIYATVLSEDEESDSIRFHLPVHVGARYGQAPEDHSWFFTLPSATHSPFLEIFVNIEAAAAIAKIGCPSHNVSTELGPDPALPNAPDLPFTNYARISFSSESALDKDFVLTVKCAGLDAPRCVAELHPIHPTVALALTLVPRFRLPDLPRPEFIFLVDRSGSMSGQRLEAAKNALIVMLRSLPAKDSLFQIASFGDICTSLWDGGSRAYNQATLDDATQHVDGMQADYGGTKIREALAHCFMARKTDRPTSIFLLTDGAAWDVDGVLSEVVASVASCTPQAHLRVSVLGIGDSASTAMCEGIARVGNGTCMMVGQQETTFTGKIARMLKAARTPMISAIGVDWGVPVVESHPTSDDDDTFVMVSDEETDHDKGTEKGKGKETKKTMLNIFDDAVDPIQMDAEPVPPRPEVVLSPPPPVQQSPFKIHTLSPGIRLNVWAILQGKTIPKAVTLSGLTEDGSEIRLSVPVTLSNLPNAPESPPVIHALAARNIIQDLEDGQHAMASSFPDDPDLLARTVRASVVRLGMLYSIASSQTSFVAVDESGASQPRGFDFSGLAPPRQGFSHSLSQVSGPSLESISSDVADDYHCYTDRLRGRKVRRAPITPPEVYLPIYPISGPSTTLDSGIAYTVDVAVKETQYLRRRCFTCHTTEPPSWRCSTAHPGKIVCNKCGLYERTTFYRRPAVRGARPFRKPAVATTCTPANNTLHTLARLQSFDGRFSPAVLSMLRLDVSLARVVLAVPDEVLASLLAMVFLRTKLGPDVEREYWEAMYEKARVFVEGALQSLPTFMGVDELEATAIAMLA